MLLQVPEVLSAEEVAHFRTALARAEWGDGRSTAGPQAAQVKSNLQLSEEHPVARELGEIVLRARKTISPR